MTAPARRKHAAAPLDHWLRAAEVRHEWFTTGLVTEPADRDTAEAVLTRFYARHGRGRPEFRWVDAPRHALPHTAGIPSHEDLRAGDVSLAGDIAARWSAFMARLDEHATFPVAARKPPRDLPRLPPREALAAGVPLRTVLRQGIRDALWTLLTAGVALRVRAALGAPSGLPISWYGQGDAPWIAYYDALRRLGLAAYPPGLDARLDDWALLARSTGWWFPGDHVCVMVDRPARIGPISLDDTAPAPVVVSRGGSIMT